jgi:hypothetical protein
MGVDGHREHPTFCVPPPPGHDQRDTAVGAQTSSERRLERLRGHDLLEVAGCGLGVGVVARWMISTPRVP